MHQQHKQRPRRHERRQCHDVQPRALQRVAQTRRRAQLRQRVHRLVDKQRVTIEQATSDPQRQTAQHAHQRLGDRKHTRQQQCILNNYPGEVKAHDEEYHPMPNRVRLQTHSVVAVKRVVHSRLPNRERDEQNHADKEDPELERLRDLRQQEAVETRDEQQHGQQVDDGPRADGPVGQWHPARGQGHNRGDPQNQVQQYEYGARR